MVLSGNPAGVGATGANGHLRSRGHLRGPDMSMSNPGSDRVTKASQCCVHGIGVELYEAWYRRAKETNRGETHFQEVRAT